ncbi:MAG: DEAD/DEAH box helicase family protein [Hydrotalea sp.]|nr:DEAD/DEAH box helicase family protein [Hydrotalea sp.]
MFEHFELKEYQTNALNLFEHYLEKLATTRVDYLEQQEKLAKAGVKATLDHDWTEKAFREVCNEKFTARKDAFGLSIPAVCYKVPTGGGKTLLATLSVIKIFYHYINQQNGFVLWIVPNEAIYSQTLKTLKDNEHPYRKFLNPAFRGKVRILTKEDRITRQMVDENLCIMVMMLQSSNRETKETLKVFKARGDYHGFFPLESDYQANKSLLEKIPNLDIHGSNFIPIIKNSLGNMLRMIRPVIVMDEQHKATSIKATKTLETFNPKFILELSATPQDYKFENGATQSPNELVKITGSQLLREGMIKIPINVKVSNDEKWQDILRQSLDKLNDLAEKSKQHFADTSRIIRPIMLVQVERTGADQRDGKVIHAEDAKEQLLKLGLKENEIKIKSANNNELENIDLLAANCAVRAIITKSALQEGWDCPFAYILVSLSSSKSLTAITQLLGRVLRQPHATKSKVEELNQSYVFCLHKETNDLIKKIKSSLENEGLGDVAYQINVANDDDNSLLEYITIKRRDKFKNTKIVLPNVVWTGDKEPRALQYESDILAYIDWLKIDMQEIANFISPYNSQAQNYTISFGNDLLKNDTIEGRLKAEELKKDFIISDAVRAINDIILNPWVGYELVKNLQIALLKKWTREQIDTQYFNIIKQFRTSLIKKSDEQAEIYFKENLKNGKITFHLRSDDLLGWSMPYAIKSKKDGKLILRNDSKPVQNSLFDNPIFDDGFNDAEEAVAVMLDEQVNWWFRNCVEDGHYHLQGWRKERVYPDFIFFLNSARNEICVWEGKGNHLAGNEDTEYKTKLMEMVSTNFSFERVSSIGKLDIDSSNGNKVSCKMVLYSNFEKTLNNYAPSPL